MSTHFSYPNINQGLEDLKLFSDMNCNENRTLYLCEIPNPATAPKWWQIHTNLQTAVRADGQCAPVVALALNGTVYHPAK